MLGAILDIVIATTEGIGDSLLLLDASFLRAGREVQARFCMIPDPKAIELIASRSRDSRNA
jgi:chemotaxis protein CheY-P-specific phosphatase CheC